MTKHDSSRRDFVKKVAYAAPAILTLSAVSSVAKAGSGNGSGSAHDRKPKPKPKPKPKKKR